MRDRDRRALVLGGLVVGCGLLVRAVPAAWGRVARAEETVAVQSDLLFRIRRELARHDAVVDSVEAMRAAAPRVAPFVLAGDSAPEALRDIMGRVSLGVAMHPATVERIEARRDTIRVGSLRRVSIAATWESDIGGVVGVLGALERDSGLVVDELEIHATSPDAPASLPEILRARAVVSGWFLAGRAEGECGEPCDIEPRGLAADHSPSAAADSVRQ